MNRVRKMGPIGVCAAVAALTISAAAPAMAQSGVSDARVKDLLRAALAQTQTRTPATAGQPSGPSRSLSMGEAVNLALEKNLDLNVGRLNPEGVDLQLAAIRAAYHPSLNSVVGQNNVVQLPTNQLAGGTAVQNDTTTYNVNLAKNMEWWGSSLTVGWTNRRVES